MDIIAKFLREVVLRRCALLGYCKTADYRKLAGALRSSLKAEIFLASRESVSFWEVLWATELVLN